MTNWIDLASLEQLEPSFEVPWLLLLDVFEHVDQLKFAASGKWSPIPVLDVTCGPDGYSGLTIADSALILPGCPVGALIGKFGGSSANLDAGVPSAAGGTVPPAAFAIGTECIMPRPATMRGPLFIGFNYRARPIKVESFKITLQGTTLG